MKIVIIGDGKVGYKLARQLSADDYDIVMIDSNERKLRFAIDRLDIFCVHGNGVDADVQKAADVPHADLVIACTSADECICGVHYRDPHRCGEGDAGTGRFKSIRDR